MPQLHNALTIEAVMIKTLRCNYFIYSAGNPSVQQACREEKIQQP